MVSLLKEYSKEKLTGQIFTPSYIIEKILNDVGYTSHENIIGKKILDPACGDGRFLLKIAERIIQHSSIDDLKENLENLYGWDIDEKSVQQSIRNLNTLLTNYNTKVNWNIKVLNALHKGIMQPDLFSTPEHIQKFDYIVGNPPYIRIQHLEPNERKFIQNHYRFCKSGSTDIYIAFYELALNLIKDTGTCGFITPNTFLHTETAKELRRYFSTRQNIVQITNYRHIQLFDNATTYSAIVIFDKRKHRDFLFQQAETNTSFKERHIEFTELKEKKFWQLSITKREKKQGRRLGDIANIHVGITTLADKIYIMPVVDAENNFIYLKSKFAGIIKIEREILKPIIKVSTLKSANEPIKEYVLFPYKKINGKHKIIPEEELKELYPLAYGYLLLMRNILDKRDGGKPNPVAWYAFGRSQGLDTSFGKKILFAPMNKKPNFIYSDKEKTTFYSGYCIKYNGDHKKLLEQLNSNRMEDFIRISARDFRNGWKAYNKRIVQEFVVYGL